MLTVIWGLKSPKKWFVNGQIEAQIDYVDSQNDKLKRSKSSKEALEQTISLTSPKPSVGGYFLRFEMTTQAHQHLVMTVSTLDIQK